MAVAASASKYKTRSQAENPVWWQPQNETSELTITENYGAIFAATGPEYVEKAMRAAEALQTQFVRIYSTEHCDRCVDVRSTATFRAVPKSSSRLNFLFSDSLCRRSKLIILVETNDFFDFCYLFFNFLVFGFS